MFLRNKGDASKSSAFSICHYNSQSFVSADGTLGRERIHVVGGVLADGVEVNVLLATAIWKGGCSELDVAEFVPENKEMLTSTISSVKGSRGTSTLVNRPTSAPAGVVILTGTTGSG